MHHAVESVDNECAKIGVGIGGRKEVYQLVIRQLAQQYLFVVMYEVSPTGTRQQAVEQDTYSSRYVELIVERGGIWYSTRSSEAPKRVRVVGGLAPLLKGECP